MLNLEVLKDYIDKKGLKQKYVAERVGLTERAFCLILMGKRNCSVNEYARICIFLDVPMETFLVQSVS